MMSKSLFTFLSIWSNKKKMKRRKKQRFYSQGRQRRKSSIEKVIKELEDFKIEIQRRFTKSRFNHRYVFPRKKYSSITKSKSAKKSNQKKPWKAKSQLNFSKSYQYLSNKDVKGHKRGEQRVGKVHIN